MGAILRATGDGRAAPARSRRCATGRAAPSAAGGLGVTDPGSAPAGAITQGRSDWPASSSRRGDRLRVLADTWVNADVPEARADLLHAIYDRIVVKGRLIVAARLTPAAYSNGLAVALPQVAMARPEGSEHAPPTMVIDDVEELVEALRAA